MKKLILGILNSQYRDWIMFSIPFILAIISTIFKCVKMYADKRRKKKKLLWVGRIDGINKSKNRNIQL